MRVLQNINEVKQKYIEWISLQKWSYFFTLTTRYELTLKSARRLVERWFNKYKIEGCYLFWVGEKFEVKDGYHIHGLLYMPDIKENDLFHGIVKKNLFWNIVEAWQLVSGNVRVSKKGKFSKQGWNAIDLSKYDKRRGAGGYCAEYIFNVNADYDFVN